MEPAHKLSTPLSVAVDAVLVLGFFVYMYTVLSGHVQSRDPWMIRLWGGLTASLMAVLFWLAIQMFRVVFRFQREQQRSRSR